MPQTIFIDRLALLTPDYQEFIFSGYPEMTAGVFAETLNLDETGRVVFENGIALFLMFFLDAAGLTRFLVTDCHVEPHLADEIISTMIQGLPSSLREAQQKIYGQINTTGSEAADTITEQTRVAILKQSSLRKIKFFQYVYTKGKLTALVRNYQIIDPVATATFKELIGDIILGFYKIEDTVPLLQQELELDAKTAALLGADVLDFLAPLSDPNWQPPIEAEDAPEEIGVAVPYQTTNEVHSVTLPVSTQVASPAFASTLQPTPNFVIPSNLQAGRAVAAAPTIVPDIHTMASDATLARSPERSSFEPVVADEVTITSNQPEARSRLSDLPAYTSGAPATIPAASPIVPETPRWGS